MVLMRSFFFSIQQILREVPANDIVLTQCVMSRSGRMLFAGTSSGTLRAMKFPLTVPGEWQEHQVHSGAITKVIVEYQKRFEIRLRVVGLFYKLLTLLFFFFVRCACLMTINTCSQYPRTLVCSSLKLLIRKAEEWNEIKKWDMQRRSLSPNLTWKKRSASDEKSIKSKNLAFRIQGRRLQSLSIELCKRI